MKEYACTGCRKSWHSATDVTTCPECGAKMVQAEHAAKDIGTPGQLAKIGAEFAAAFEQYPEDCPIIDKIGDCEDCPFAKACDLVVEAIEAKEATAL